MTVTIEPFMICSNQEDWDALSIADENNVLLTSNIYNDCCSVFLDKGHNYESKIIPPTCTENGYTTYNCKCGDNFIDNYTKFDGHAYSNGCDVTCNNCDFVRTDINHDNTINVVEVKATCTRKGSTAGVYCNDCQKYISGHKEIAINPSNHVNTKTVPATPATFDKVGYTEGVFCNDCQKYISGHKEIPVLMNIGDVDGNGKIDATDARLALRAAVGLETLSVSQKKTSDVDFDGQVTSSDARLILRAAVGLEELKKRNK